MEAGAELVARARLICGEQHVITSPTMLSIYRSDGLRRNGPLPVAAILPSSASEVTGVVAACAATGSPYVVRGAGTSDSGSALPVADGVLIVLTRMRRVLAISQDREEVTVEPGTPPAALRRALPARWFEEPEPSGTVGGLLAATVGVPNIAGLDLVQPDGTFVRLDARDPGYDLTGAFPGSRGRAGIAVAITLRALSRR
ncbi:MAG TPA: FAD-binding oxidoreductase [Solirubrobacteraceae bacterium]|jgi:glycolate oxidase|nr:FAD-binding oxidoreductase [Solirubrobacteraceae bacterium]